MRILLSGDAKSNCLASIAPSSVSRKARQGEARVVGRGGVVFRSCVFGTGENPGGFPSRATAVGSSFWKPIIGCARMTGFCRFWYWFYQHMKTRFQATGLTPDITTLRWLVVLEWLLPVLVQTGRIGREMLPQRGKRHPRRNGRHLVPKREQTRGATNSSFQAKETHTNSPSKMGDTMDSTKPHWKVQHNYHDYSQARDSGRGAGSNGGGGGKQEGRSQDSKFPILLHYILGELEKEGKSHVMGWMTHGRAFIVRDQKRLEEEILPK